MVSLRPGNPRVFELDLLGLEPALAGAASESGAYLSLALTVPGRLDILALELVGQVLRCSVVRVDGKELDEDLGEATVTLQRQDA